MGALFSPNYSVLRNWNSTLTVAFAQLRRTAFAVENTFTFSSFDPQINWLGMTATAVALSKCRYCKIGKLLYLSIDIQSTLAAPFNNDVAISLPENSTAYGASTDLQAGGVGLVNAGVNETGIWRIFGGTNFLSFRRTAAGNYTAGAFRATGNFFIEVI